MIETTHQSLDQKPAGIKVAPASAASRAFVLWMALLLLYFLILPSAAESGPPAGLTAGAGTQAAAARLERRTGPFAEAAAVPAAVD